MRVLCSDIDHNHRTESYPVTVSVACDCELQLPMLPRSMRAFPRYIVDLKPTRDGPGRWVNILFEDDRVIRFFTSDYAQLFRYIQGFCPVCAVPQMQCDCVSIQNEDAVWQLYSSTHTQIINNRTLNRASYEPTHFLYANLEFHTTQVQSEKVYTTLLTDQKEFEPFIKLAEDICTLYWSFRRSAGFQDLMCASLAFVRSVTGRSASYMIKEVVEELLNGIVGTSVVQSDRHWTETLSDLYENYNRAKTSILGERLKRVFNHIIAHSVYHKLGIEVDQKLFDEFERKTIRINLMQCATFLDASVGLVTFLLKQGRQCMILKSFEPMYISSETTGDWFERAKTALMRFESVCNPQAIGVSVHELLGELNQVLSEGKSLAKFTSQNKANNFYISRTVIELNRTYNAYIVACAACATRKTPFAICIFGSPGVGKGSILDILSTYDCELRNKSKDKSFVYLHPADSEFFDLFRTWMHTMVFEDAAQLNPSKLNGVDPSVQFFMKAINNQPWCPPQAALEDKGKTPVMVDTVFVTSNTLDLNIPAYYQHTYAPMRRFPLHIEPIVKEIYRTTGGTSIDYNKAKSIPGQFDDFWHFKIRAPKEMGTNPGYCGVFEERTELYCDGMKELLALYKKMCLAHHAKEEGMLQKYADAASVQICSKCADPKVYCQCEDSEPQAKVEYDDGFNSAAPAIVNSDSEDKSDASYSSSVVSMSPDDEFLLSEMKTDDSNSSSQNSLSPDMDCIGSQISEPKTLVKTKVSLAGTVPAFVSKMFKSSAEEIPKCKYHDETVACTTECAKKKIFEDHYGDEFFAEAKDFFCPSYKFGQIVFPDAELGAWRDRDIAKKKPRIGNNILFKKFLKRFEKRKSQAIQYVNMHINDSLELGYDDGEIALDFIRWCKNDEERKALEELDGMVDVLMTKTAPGVVIKSTWADYLIQCAIYAYFHYSVVRWTFNTIGGYAFIRRRIMPLLRPMLVRSHNQKYFMRELGSFLDDKIGTLPNWGKTLVLALGAASALATFYALGRGVMAITGATKEEDILFTREDLERQTNVGYNDRDYEKMAEDSTDSWFRIGPSKQDLLDKRTGDGTGILPLNEEQQKKLDERNKAGMIASMEYDLALTRGEPTEVQMGTFPRPLNEKMKVNPWVVPERTLTELDFSTKRITEQKALRRNLAFNTLVVSHHGRDIGDFVTKFRMLALNEYTFLINNHSLEPQDSYRLVVHFGVVGGGDEVRIRIEESQIKRFPTRDIAIIHTKAIPNRFKKIQNNFPRRSFNNPCNGYIFQKTENGDATRLDLISMDRSFVSKSIRGHEYNYQCYVGRPLQPTQNGDSGSPWVAETAYGDMIVGIHAILHANQIAGCTLVHLEDIHEWCQPMVATVGTIEVTTPIVQNGKSYIDYHKEKYMTYHGELEGFRARPKHHVYDTELAEQVYGKTVGGSVIERRLTGPVMDNWRPQQVSLSEFVTPVCNMSEPIVEACFTAFFEHVLKELPRSELELLHPYPIEVAINGAPGITFVDGIKKSTSMGYPWRKPKRNFVIPLEDDRFQDGVTFTPEIDARIQDRLERLKQGIRMHPVFSASLKDEPVSFKKVRLCKTRVFFCCPADFLIVVRMCFMSFCRVAQRNPFVFGVAIGMNPHSVDWDKIYRHLSKNPVKNTVAGDHVFYDKKMQLLFLRYAMLFVIKLYEEAGQVTKEELVVYYTIVDDMVNPTVDYFGMLVTFMGGEVSGHQMTTILNCLLDKGYIMYAYMVLFKFIHDFFEHVRIITLGDDHVFTVSEQRKALSHTAVQSVLKDLGLDYTMAEKDADSVPFIELKDAPFLKRKFVYSSELGCVVGPIERNTIFKMLTINVISKSATKEEQLAQSICAAIAESFFHGKEFFDEFTSFVDSLKKSPRLEAQMKKYPALTWEQYVSRFHEASNSKLAIRAGQGDEPNQKSALVSSDCFDEPPTLQSLKRMGPQVTNPARAILEIHVYGRLELEPKDGGTVVQSELTVLPDKKQLATHQSLTGSYADQAVPETAAQSTDTVQETTMFVNEPSPNILDLSTKFDEVGMKQRAIAHLGDFLKRPVLLTQYRWTENGAAGFKFAFDPYMMYFSTTAIKNKLAGFGLLRPNLRLKFLINGSPFYYGKLGAFYRPFATSATEMVPTSIPINLQQIGISQRPHVWLDNQSTSTEELALPFLNPNPYVSTMTLAELSNLGSVELWQYATLRSANGVTTSGIDVSVYAYCDDFELAGPTNITVLQSSKEYKSNGQISGPASTVASVASQLKNVPIIGAYATATETAANMVGSVANFFGFTNVPVIEDVKPLKPIPFQLASSTIGEPVMKLGLQPKQEIAVGSEHCGGSNEDELLIQKLVERESFLCGALWTTTASTGDTLFVSQVTPALYEFDAATSSVMHTPISYWSCLFEYWRGPIIFRFKVVRSAYHRGRLNINWDQACKTVNSIPSIGNANTMNVVLDLDECDEVEVEVPYVQAKNFLKCVTGGWTYPNARTWENSNSVVILKSGEFNGMISVKVMNRLTAPEATSDVDLLVFVRAGKDFQFAAPCEIDPNWTHSAIESTVLQSEKIYTLGNSGDDTNVYKEVFGEQISSLRELLHRSSLSYNISPPLAATAGSFNSIIPIKRYPRPPGFFNNGWDSGETATAGTYKPYNFSRMTHLNWTLPVFIGYKGSVNVTVNVVNNFNANSLDRIEISRRNPGQSSVDTTRRPDYFTLADTLSYSKRAKQMNTQTKWGHDGLSGSALTNQKTNAGMVANLPYYTISKFLTTDPYVQYSNQDVITGSNDDWFDLQISTYKNTADLFAKGLYYQVFYASGPDFDVVFNLSCPAVFYKDRAGQ